MRRPHALLRTLPLLNELILGGVTWGSGLLLARHTRGGVLDLV
jgi:hypothetical protein